MRNSRQGLKLASHGTQAVEAKPDLPDQISEHDYLTLSAWRDTLRHFMTASKLILKDVDITPNQYQAMLAIRFGNKEEQLTVGELARNLHIRHNSAVTLINKLVLRNLVRRLTSSRDRRVVYLHLTPKGETMLRRLVTAHRRELDAISPILKDILP